MVINNSFPYHSWDYDKIEIGFLFWGKLDIIFYAQYPEENWVFLVHTNIHSITSMYQLD